MKISKAVPRAEVNSKPNSAVVLSAGRGSPLPV